MSGVRPKAAFYYPRFMWCGVRAIWPGGAYSLRESIAAIHNEYRCLPPDWRGDPVCDVWNCLEYWEDGA